jgi:KAP family P-loop domain
MRLTPPPPAIGETGFAKENDLFELREFGERPANLVCRVNEPLVIALDGPWGGGKSTFLRQWTGLLKQRGVPVILFDAFVNDHQEDAFISLASEITALAQAKAKEGGAAVGNFIDKAKKAGRVLMPLAARAGLRAATLNLMSLEDLKDLSDGMQEAVKATAEDASALTERLIEERLERAKGDRDTLKAFRVSLSELAAQLGSVEPSSAEHDVRKPLVFIIDELDRCRPPFALNLLERVKHLFSVDNVCFVLVAHLPQLAAVIRGSYGSDVDGRTYLEKFYHLRIELPEPNVQGQNRTAKYVSYLWQAMDIRTGDHGYDGAAQRGLVALGAAYGLSLRSLERVAAYVALVRATITNKHFREPCLVVGLCLMKQREPELFAQARSAALTWGDAAKFLRLGVWSDEKAREWYENWWRFVTEVDLAIEDHWVKAINSSLFQFGLERHQILPLMCKFIESLDIGDN